MSSMERHHHHDVIDVFTDVPLWANLREQSRAGFSNLEQLHTKVLDFYHFLRPSLQERRMRELAVRRIRKFAHSMWPGSGIQVFVYGSSASDFYLPSGDVDILILNSPTHVPVCQRLYAFADRLRCASIATDVQVLPRARVPIVKFLESKSGLSFDVSLTSSFKELDAANLIKQTAAEFPSFGPLYMVLKAFLHSRGLNRVFQTGGITSYPLFVMVKAFLQFFRKWAGGGHTFSEEDVPEELLPWYRGEIEGNDDDICTMPFHPKHLYREDYKLDLWYGHAQHSLLEFEENAGLGFLLRNFVSRDQYMLEQLVIEDPLTPSMDIDFLFENILPFERQLYLVEVYYDEFWSDTCKSSSTPL
ncbi:hypothetical protein GOP47_0021663 [Adiantum capillus-veneris]|uniref:Poly(A) RNA polymerase mitochondrial-like central palm domain-containing protein n=1 Tax=Adiantum capillus-veneris TaxID=13818 RepID=A0A9D4Z830_ADICA|nr:hypothetical protein GOP47_0021663 [Adiantum capillus-veneris]